MYQVYNKSEYYIISDGPIPVGKMYLNSVSKMMKFGGSTNNTLVNPSLADLDADSDNEDDNSGKLLVHTFMSEVIVLQ